MACIVLALQALHAVPDGKFSIFTSSASFTRFRSRRRPPPPSPSLSEGGTEPSGPCGPFGPPGGGGGGSRPLEYGGPQFQFGGLPPPPSPGPPLLRSPPSPQSPPFPPGSGLGGFQIDDLAMDGSCVVATLVGSLVVVVVDTPKAGAVPGANVVGPCPEETLAPDTDPAVFVGAPVGRSEPPAFAGRRVANGSNGCVVKTSALLGVKSKNSSRCCEIRSLR